VSVTFLSFFFLTDADNCRFDDSFRNPELVMKARKYHAHVNAARTMSDTRASACLPMCWRTLCVCSHNLARVDLVEFSTLSSRDAMCPNRIGIRLFRHLAGSSRTTSFVSHRCSRCDPRATSVL